MIPVKYEDKDFLLNLPPTFYEVPRRPLTRAASSQLTHCMQSSFSYTKFTFLVNPPPTEAPLTRGHNPPTEVPAAAVEPEERKFSTDSSSSSEMYSDQAMEEDEFSGLQIVTAAIVTAIPEPDSLYCVTAPTFKLPSSKVPLQGWIVV